MKIINRFHEIFSATILSALSTNCYRLVEETFPAPKSQKNKREADFANIILKLKMSATIEKKNVEVVVVSILQKFYKSHEIFKLSA